MVAPVAPGRPRSSTLVTLLVAACLIASCSDPTTSAQREPAALGVFRGATGTNEVDRFSTWLGRDLETALTFVDYFTWEDIEGPDWFLDPWQQWVGAAAGRTLVVSVAMLPGPWVPDEVVREELQAGATGVFDTHFRTLASRLVEHGLGRSILRIGWEANGGWYRWRASPDPEAWVLYFRRIVDVMSTVDGADFTIDWSVSVPVEERPADRLYPGDDVVDLIGVDVYDKSWQDDTYPYPDGSDQRDRRVRQERVWGLIVDGGEIGQGLEYWSEFADEHNKELSVPEWGVVDLVESGLQRGGLDNPDFVARMADWIDSHDVAYHVYFEWDSGEAGGDHQLSNPATTFPETADAFIRRFGSGGGD